MIVEREKNDESKLKVLGNCWWKILLFKQQQLSTTLPCLQKVYSQLKLAGLKIQKLKLVLGTC